jgi:hypothetical protein
MELRRFGWEFWDVELLELDIEGRVSRSVAEKERFLEGERKELGDNEGRRWDGEG